LVVIWNSPKFFACIPLTSSVTCPVIWAWSVPSGSMRNCLVTCNKLQYYAATSIYRHYTLGFPHAPRGWRYWLYMPNLLIMHISGLNWQGRRLTRRMNVLTSGQQPAPSETMFACNTCASYLGGWPRGLGLGYRPQQSNDNTQLLVSSCNGLFLSIIFQLRNT